MSVRVIAAAGAALIASITLWFPWWHAEHAPWVAEDQVWRGPVPTRSGWEVLGWPALMLLLPVLLLPAGAIRRRVDVAGAGICVGGAIVAGLAAHALLMTSTLGAAPAIALVGGVVAAVLAIDSVYNPTQMRVLPVVVVVAAMVIGAVVPQPSRGALAEAPDTPRAFTHVVTTGIRSDPIGVRGLATPSLTARLTVLSGRPVLYTDNVMTTTDSHGRTEAVVETSRWSVRSLGVFRDRIVVQVWRRLAMIGPGTKVTYLDNVVDASHVGADGTVWVRASDTTLREVRLDSALPKGALTLPRITAAVDSLALLTPTKAGALIARRAGGYGYRLALVKPDGTTLPVAGAPDDSCGLTADPLRSYFDGLPTVESDNAGGWWIAHEQGRTTRITHIGADGRHTRIPEAAPGRLRQMAVDTDGTLLLHLMHGSYDSYQVVRTSTTHLRPLPAPAASCLAEVPRVAPPLRTTPVGAPAREPLTVLSADGTYVSARRGGDSHTIVNPAGHAVRSWWRSNTPTGSPISDDADGLWWLEQSPVASTPGADPAPGDEPRMTIEKMYDLVLAHGTRDGAVTRIALIPTTFETASLIEGPGRPLLLSSTGLWRVADDGSLTAAVDGPVNDALRTGRGGPSADEMWVTTRDSLDRIVGGTRTTIIGPRPAQGESGAGHTRTASPAGMQLARGVSPTALALRSAELASAPGGGIWVFTDDIVLHVTDGGGVSVVAQNQFAGEYAIFRADEGAFVLLSDADGLYRWMRLDRD